LESAFKAEADHCKVELNPGKYTLAHIGTIHSAAKTDEICADRYYALNFTLTEFKTRLEKTLGYTQAEAPAQDWHEIAGPPGGYRVRFGMPYPFKQCGNPSWGGWPSPYWGGSGSGFLNENEWITVESRAYVFANANEAIFHNFCVSPRRALMRPVPTALLQRVVRRVRAVHRALGLQLQRNVLPSEPDHERPPHTTGHDQPRVGPRLGSNHAATSIEDPGPPIVCTIPRSIMHDCYPSPTNVEWPQAIDRDQNPDTIHVSVDNVARTATDSQ
jgi:hypothetical protein